jgi:hypothetical protein
LAAKKVRSVPVQVEEPETRPATVRPFNTSHAGLASVGTTMVAASNIGSTIVARWRTNSRRSKYRCWAKLARCVTVFCRTNTSVASIHSMGLSPGLLAWITTSIRLKTACTVSPCRVRMALSHCFMSTQRFSSHSVNRSQNPED